MASGRVEELRVARRAELRAVVERLDLARHRHHRAEGQREDGDEAEPEQDERETQAPHARGHRGPAREAADPAVAAVVSVVAVARGFGARGGFRRQLLHMWGRPCGCGRAVGRWRGTAQAATLALRSVRTEDGVEGGRAAEDVARRPPERPTRTPPRARAAPDRRPATRTPPRPGSCATRWRRSPRGRSSASSPRGARCGSSWASIPRRPTSISATPSSWASCASSRTSATASSSSSATTPRGSATRAGARRCGPSSTRPRSTRTRPPTSARPSRVLDRERTEVRRNGEWLAMPAEDLFRLARTSTLAQLLERDDFATRHAARQPISILELLYPLLQGYDSVAVRADVELGGTDQKFNLLLAREIQKAYGRGAAGRPHHAHPARHRRRAPDVQEPRQLRRGRRAAGGDLRQGHAPARPRDGRVVLACCSTARSIRSRPPVESKRALAREIAARFHGAAAARAAEERFNRLHVSARAPDEVPEAALPAEDPVNVPALVGGRVRALALRGAAAARPGGRAPRRGAGRAEELELPAEAARRGGPPARQAPLHAAASRRRTGVSASQPRPGRRLRARRATAAPAGARRRAPYTDRSERGTRRLAWAPVIDAVLVPRYIRRPTDGLDRNDRTAQA